MTHFQVRDRRIIVEGIVIHLTADAEIETRRKKTLRPNPIGPWELRIDRFRIFYTIEAGNVVKIVAVGSKEGNELFIRGKRVEL